MIMNGGTIMLCVMLVTVREARVIVLCRAGVLVIPPSDGIVVTIPKSCSQSAEAIVVIPGPCPEVLCNSEQNCHRKKRNTEPTHGYLPRTQHYECS